jgi:phosphoglycolate phosphatase
MTQLNANHVFQPPFKLVVFDWDGTLLDSAGAIVSAIQSASRDLGVEVPSDYAARQVIGLGLSEALQRAVPSLPSEAYPQMVDRYRYHYLGSDHQLCLFEGVPDMIKSLFEQGVTLAVATGKSRVGLNRALDHSGLSAFFSATRCADECHSKPNPQMLLEILDELGFSSDAAVMVGDTSHDLKMANNAGVAGLGVAYGAHLSAELSACNPIACFDSVLELSNWLQGKASVFSTS